MSSTHQDGSMTGGTAGLDEWRMMEERIETMEEKASKSADEGGESVASGAAVTRPGNERSMKENLRKFVAAKAFLSWKFILKKDRLGSCIVLAINKSHVMVPPGFKERQLAKLCGPTTQAFVLLEAEQKRKLQEGKDAQAHEKMHVQCENSAIVVHHLELLIVTASCNVLI